MYLIQYNTIFARVRTVQMANVVSTRDAGKAQRMARLARPLPPPPSPPSPQSPPPADSSNAAPGNEPPSTPPTGARSPSHPYQNLSEVQRALAPTRSSGVGLVDSPAPAPHGMQHQHSSPGPSQGHPQSCDLRFIDADSTIRSSAAPGSQTDGPPASAAPVPAPRLKKSSVDSILSGGESTSSSVASVPELNAGIRVCIRKRHYTVYTQATVYTYIELMIVG